MTVTSGSPYLTVAEAITAMAIAVQSGDFSLAESIGAAAPVPLSIPQSSLRTLYPISQGAQASVFAAELADYENGPVAVKKGVIREHSDLVRLRREVVFLHQLRHPHVVRLIGARLLPPNYQIILELAATNAAHEMYSEKWRPKWAGAIFLGAQLCSAIVHLHANGVIHRDIKPANLLLSANRRTAHLADLGISLCLKNENGDESGESDALDSWKGAGNPSGGFYKRQMVGTLEYMAPEILLKQPHSRGSDVFALGVMINELASASLPYSDCTRDNPLAHTILEMGYGRQELAAAVAAEGLRPTVPPGAPPAMVRLLRSCWDADPQRRPSAEEVLSVLVALSEVHPWVKDDNDGEGEIEVEKQQPELGAAATTTTTTVLQELVTPPWAEELISSSSNNNKSIRIGSFATAGARGEDRMEDRCCVIRCLFGLQQCCLAAVFDGHRGSAAAEYLASTLERHLEERWSSSTSPGELLQQALLDADASFRCRSDGGPPKYSGSTAVVALMVGNSSLTVANLGDSRAVLCQYQYSPDPDSSTSKRAVTIDLTVDQTAEREDERARVEAAGGDVSVRLGEWRVGTAGLAVTRSIGDADLKGSGGVIATAEITQRDICGGGGGGGGGDVNEDAFMILASDGVWDLVASEAVVGLVLDTVKQPAMCAQRVVMEALARGSKDNVSAVVVLFSSSSDNPNSSSTVEKVFASDNGTGNKVTNVGAAAARVAARLVEDEIRETY